MDAGDSSHNFRGIMSTKAESLDIELTSIGRPPTKN